MRKEITPEMRAATQRVIQRITELTKPNEQKAFDPRIDPQACSLCKSENVTDAKTMRPSGICLQIICENGHTTNGMPTAAYFAERVEESSS